jgi:hypothetical protein
MYSDEASASCREGHPQALIPAERTRRVSLLQLIESRPTDPSRPLFIFDRRCSRANDLRCHTMCRLEPVAGCPRLPLHPDPRPSVDP